MKKVLCLFLSLCLALSMTAALTSCGNEKKPEKPDPKQSESEKQSETEKQPEVKTAFGDKDIETVINELIAKAKELDTDEFGLNSLEDAEREMLLYNTKLTNEDCEQVLGLSEEEFGQYVETAVENRLSNASFMTYSTVLVKLKDGADVKSIANKIVSGTSPNRFGCLTPSCILGGYSGQYVFFMASEEVSCQALVDAVKALSALEVTEITRENTWSGGGFFGGGMLGD